MIRILLSIIWALFFAKAIFFWFWLWQLKEYHLGRLKAHFETAGLKKFLSGYWRIKTPKPTGKMVLISLTGIIFEWLVWRMLYWNWPSFFYWGIVVSLLLSPLFAAIIVFLWQIPTEIVKTFVLKLAGWKIKRMKKMLVIGITGSYGKTSAKEFLFDILSKKFLPAQACIGRQAGNVLKTPAHVNSEIGIAKTILKSLKKEIEIFIVEMGAYQKGKIRQVCRMVGPKIGVLTGINEQHQSTFGSLENIIAAKLELIESLPEDGLAVLNGNNELIKSKFTRSSDRVPRQMTGQNYKLIEGKNQFYEAVLKDFLPWDKENFLLAAAVAEYLGISPEDIKDIAKSAKSQIKIVKGLNGADVFSSTYSANPKSVFDHLSFFKNHSGNPAEKPFYGARILIMPCLIELGKSAKKIHFEIGQQIGKTCDMAIITTDDWFNELKSGALESGMLPEKIIFCPNAKEIFATLKPVVGSGDVIILESRQPKGLVDVLINKQ